MVDSVVPTQVSGAGLIAFADNTMRKRKVEGDQEDMLIKAKKWREEVNKEVAELIHRQDPTRSGEIAKRPDEVEPLMVAEEPLISHGEMVAEEPLMVAEEPMMVAEELTPTHVELTPSLVAEEPMIVAEELTPTHVELTPSPSPTFSFGEPAEESEHKRRRTSLRVGELLQRLRLASLTDKEATPSPTFSFGEPAEEHTRRRTSSASLR